MWREIVFGVMYILSVWYLSVVSKYEHHQSHFNLRKFFLGFFILQKQWDPNFPLLCITFLLCMDVQPYSHDFFSKISRTLFDFLNNTSWVSFFLKKQLANILDRGFLFLCNTLLLYSLSPYWRTTERQTETQIHLLCVGWRNLFSSCAVVSVFGSGRK
jgi:hypothetical protein